MVFKNFFLRLLLYILAIVVTIFLLSWFWFSNVKMIFIIHLALLIVVEILLLIRFLNKWNRELYNFFANLKTSQFEWSGNLAGSQLGAIKEPLAALKDRLRRQRQQQEVEYEYFRVMSRNIASGLLVVESDGRVIFSNPAALELLDLPVIKNFGSVERKMPGVRKIFDEMKPGEARQLAWGSADNKKELQIKMAGFNSADRTYRIYSFDNIQPAISRNEVESWQKLLRVLNHEIMNSVGPINSTSDLLLDSWKDSTTKNQPDEKLVSKTIRGLEVIGERSRGLSNFVKAYRSLTKIPEPKMQEVPVQNLLIHIRDLLSNQLKEQQTNLLFEIPEKGTLHTDQGFLQQILINLVINAIEAMKDSSKANFEILISFKVHDERKVILVKDNGKGMDAETIEKCTVPFFTTKAEGSGIGMSLARQLMQAMGGSMEISSEPNVGTEVRLIFP